MMVFYIHHTCVGPHASGWPNIAARQNAGRCRDDERTMEEGVRGADRPGSLPLPPGCWSWLSALFISSSKFDGI